MASTSSDPLALTLTRSILGAAGLYCLVKPLSTADLSVFMKMGELMASRGGLAEEEILSFSEIGRTFMNGTWLSQRVFYEVFDLGGYPLLVLLLTTCVMLTLGVVAHHGRLRGGREGMATAAVAWAFVLLLQNMGLRPQTFSLPCFALSYLITDMYRDRRWAIPALALIYCLWANLHGAFPAGLVVMGGLTAGEVWSVWRAGGLSGLRKDRAIRRLTLLMGVAFLSTWIGPYGPGIYTYVAENSSMPSTRHLDEWLPAAPLSFMGIRLYGSALLLGVLALTTRSVRVGDLALALAFFWLAQGSQRMILWWGLVTAPMVAHLLAVRWPQPSGSPLPLHRRLLGVSTAFWLLLFLLANPWMERKDNNRATGEGFSGLERDTPVEAVQVMEQIPTQGARVYADMMWGGYVLWRLWPTYSVMVDPRIWVFGDTTWEDWLSISLAEPGWEEKLDHYQVDFLLLEKHRQAKLHEVVSTGTQWSLLYEDERSALWRRGETKLE